MGEPRSRVRHARRAVGSSRGAGRQAEHRGGLSGGEGHGEDCGRARATRAMAWACRGSAAPRGARTAVGRRGPSAVERRISRPAREGRGGDGGRGGPRGERGASRVRPRPEARRRGRRLVRRRGAAAKGQKRAPQRRERAPPSGGREWREARSYPSTISKTEAQTGGPMPDSLPEGSAYQPVRFSSTGRWEERSVTKCASAFFDLSGFLKMRLGSPYAM